MMAAGAGRIDGPAGRIDCLLRLPETEPRFAAAVCHPHPLYGGTMHNKVVHRVAGALARAGGVALRFQFRGVGLSAGSHDEGRGEGDDVRAVLDHLAGEAPGLPLVVAGYSFGAWVGLRVGATDVRVAALIGVALATTIHSFDELAHCEKPKLIVQGAADALGPESDVRALAATLKPPVTLHVVAGADHFFAANLDDLSGAVLSFARQI